MIRPSRAKSNIARVNKKKLVVLFGPTAVGKTALTLALFKNHYEIINSDSVQVYKHLDIASAKPDKITRQTIRHHLIDILEPYEQFNVGSYCQLADSLIPEILSRGNYPLLTGGTAYYFRQFLYGVASTPEAEPDVRAKVKAEIDEKGKEWAYSYLRKIDPVSADRINPNDLYRISRAIEVYYQSGRPLSSFKVNNTIRTDLEPLIIGLHLDKKELDARIEKRVDAMFSSGLVDEIKDLKAMGALPSWPGLQAIGYKEFFIPGLSLDEIRERIIVSTRQYAKRQMTFFRSFENVNWFSPDDYEGISRLLEASGYPLG